MRITGLRSGAGDGRRARRSVRRAAAATVAVLTLGALAACSEDSSDASPASAGSSDGASDGASGDPSASPTVSTGSDDYLPVPINVRLTPQGTKLALGDRAYVAYQPKQKVVAALSVTVTKVESTSFAQTFAGLELSDQVRTTAPYFVRARITNVGETDLGDRPVPLYVVDDQNTLVEASSFVAPFKACPSTPFPKTFGPGDSVSTCLVYLVPRKGDVDAVSFRPTQDFDPITWSGVVRPYRAPRAASGSASPAS